MRNRLVGLTGGSSFSVKTCRVLVQQQGVDKKDEFEAQGYNPKFEDGVAKRYAESSECHGT